MKIKDREPLLENADVLDAALCCLAGADFMLGKSRQSEKQEWAKKEGWIWAREKSGHSKK